MVFSLAAVTWHLQTQKFSLSSVRHPGRILKDIIPLSAPVTANRVLITLLNSLEAILIPVRLRMSGLNTTQSLSIYGTFSGMALPLVLFPSTVTNAVSVMLLPSVSEAQARGNNRAIQKTIETTLKYCLILGIFSTGLFFCYGPRLGLYLFHSSAAGLFVRILSFICPFLYLDVTLSSILQGLGKTGLCFVNNALGVSLRILMVLFAVPSQGIQGYLWGLLASELLCAALDLTALRRCSEIHFDAVSWLLKPAAALGIALGSTLFFSIFFKILKFLPSIAVLGLEMAVCGVLYLAVLVCMGILKKE